MDLKEFVADLIDLAGGHLSRLKVHLKLFKKEYKRCELLLRGLRGYYPVSFVEATQKLIS